MGSYQNLRSLIVLTLLSLVPGIVRGDKRPNILFIFSDDHAVNAISAYGSRLRDVAPTPHIDRIARELSLIHI